MIEESWVPGETMIVRRLPCVGCGSASPRYIERRLCAPCYRRKAKRRGLGRLSSREVFALWTAPYPTAYGACLAWLGHISPEGYGKLRGTYTHRLSHEFFTGPIPDGLHVDHLCRNRWCCNPHHLEAVTPAENVRRWSALVTHCPHGHEYSENNTHVTKAGTRACRACKRDQVRRYTEEKLALGWTRTANGWIRGREA